MKKYELVYILKPTLEDEKKEAVFNKMKEIIETSGQIDKVDTWGTRKLAYPIEKHTQGFYNLVRFTAEKEAVNEMDRNLKIMDSVIRHLVVRIDEK